MESSGEALRIHISAATKALLDRLGGYHTQERGVTPIKVSAASSVPGLFSVSVLELRCLSHRLTGQGPNDDALAGEPGAVEDQTAIRRRGPGRIVLHDDRSGFDRCLADSAGDSRYLRRRRHRFLGSTVERSGQRNVDVEHLAAVGMPLAAATGNQCRHDFERGHSFCG